MYEILSIVVLNLATVFVLASRLNTIDADLSTWQYVKKMLAAQARLGTLFTGPLGQSELTRKPDGMPIHRAFPNYVGLSAALCLIYIVAAAVLTTIHGR